jgi:hypothetical protein
VSGHLHALATFFPGEQASVPIEKKIVDPRAGLDALFTILFLKHGHHLNESYSYGRERIISCYRACQLSKAKVVGSHVRQNDRI